MHDATFLQHVGIKQICYSGDDIILCTFNLMVICMMVILVFVLQKSFSKLIFWFFSFFFSPIRTGSELVLEVKYLKNYLY